MALKVLREVDEKDAYANLALDEALRRSHLEPRERALATELVYGVTRRRATLDWALNHCATRPIGHMDPWVRAALRQGAYQVMYLTRIPQSAAVNEAVELAKRYGHAGTGKFVNGVLRGLLRKLPTLEFPDPESEPVISLALRYSHPAWLVEDWLERFGREETIRLMEAGNLVPPVTIRVNRRKITRDELQARLAAEGITAAPTHWSNDGLVLGGLNSALGLAKLSAFQDGLFLVQDESSMLVAPVVAPQPGEFIIDVAAAPGGKTTHMAELMGPEGRILAMDVHPHKATLVKENAKRLGLNTVQVMTADAREVGSLFPQQADAVLVDAPCSGLGTLARRPDARWRKAPEDIDALTVIQREILKSAAKAVKPGGRLVYSTCTIEPKENQEMIAWFLVEHPEFKPDTIWSYLPAGLWREPGAAEGMVQILPHRHGMDGFFIARVRRTE